MSNPHDSMRLQFLDCFGSCLTITEHVRVDDGHAAKHGRYQCLACKTERPEHIKKGTKRQAKNVVMNTKKMRKLSKRKRERARQAFVTGRG